MDSKSSGSRIAGLLVSIASVAFLFTALPIYKNADAEGQARTQRLERAKRLAGIGADALKAGDTAMANRAYTTALQLDPSDANTREALALIYARTILEKPSESDGATRLRVQQALSEVLVSGVKSNQALLKTAYAKTLLDRGFDKIAIQYLNQAIKADSKFADAHLYLGDAQMRKKAWATAGESIKKSLVLRPEHALSHYAMGQVYAGQSKWKLAVEHMERAVRTLDSSSMVWAELGRAQLMVKDTFSAEKSLEKAIKFGSTGLRAAVGYAESLMANGKHEGALRQFVGLYQKTGRPELLARVGGLQLRLANFRGAVQSYQELRKLQPENPNPACRLGYAYVRLGAVAQALNAYTWCQRKSLGQQKYEKLEKMATEEVKRLTPLIKASQAPAGQYKRRAPAKAKK